MKTLVCKNPSQRLPSIKEGVPVTIEYFLVNETPETLDVRHLGSSCGCSTPSLPKSTIEPNEEMTMTVVFDTLGKKGLQEKNVWVNYKGDKFKGRVSMKFVIDVTK